MRIERADDYLRASLERMSQARRLYEEGNSYALSMYVSGLAVECLLRAFKATKTTEFDEKHDIRRLFKASGLLDEAPDQIPGRGLSDAERTKIERDLQASVSEVYSLWDNAHRYASEDRMRAYLRGRKRDRGVRGDPLKANALVLLKAAQTFHDKGVIRWISSRKSKRS